MQSFKLAQPHWHTFIRCMNVEYRQCKFIRTYFLLYQGKMMCESEVNQDILSRTNFCFIRTEFYLFSGAYKWGVLSIFTGAIIVFAMLSSSIQLPINAFHSSGLAKKQPSPMLSLLSLYAALVYLNKFYAWLCCAKGVSARV